MVPANGPSVSVVRTTATTDSTGRTGAASGASSRQAARPSSKASAIVQSGAFIAYGPVGLRSLTISTFWPGRSICTPALTTISPVCRPLDTAIRSLV